MGPLPSGTYNHPNTIQIRRGDTARRRVGSTEMAPGKRSAIGGLATLAFGQRSCQQMLIDGFANQLVQQGLLPLTCAAPAGLIVC